MTRGMLEFHSLCPPYDPSYSIFFLKTTNTWHFEDEDGTEMEFDAAKGAWLPAVRAVSAYRQCQLIWVTA